MTSDNITTAYGFRRLLQGFVESVDIEAKVSVRDGGDALLARIECKNLDDTQSLERFVLRHREEFGTRGADATVLVQFPGLTVSLPKPEPTAQGDAARGESFLSKTFPTKPEAFEW